MAGVTTKVVTSLSSRAAGIRGEELLVLRVGPIPQPSYSNYLNCPITVTMLSPITVNILIFLYKLDTHLDQLINDQVNPSSSFLRYCSPA